MLVRCQPEPACTCRDLDNHTHLYWDELFKGVQSVPDGLQGGALLSQRVHNGLHGRVHVASRPYALLHEVCRGHTKSAAVLLQELADTDTC